MVFYNDHADEINVKKAIKVSNWLGVGTFKEKYQNQYSIRKPLKQSFSEVWHEKIIVLGWLSPHTKLLTQDKKHWTHDYIENTYTVRWTFHEDSFRQISWGIFHTLAVFPEPHRSRFTYIIQTVLEVVSEKPKTRVQIKSIFELKVKKLFKFCDFAVKNDKKVCKGHEKQLNFIVCVTMQSSNVYRHSFIMPHPPTYPEVSF